MARNCIGLTLSLSAGIILSASAALAKEVPAPAAPAAPAVPSAATPAYSRYNMEELKKKFPHYPSHLQLDKALTKENAKFNAPSLMTCSMMNGRTPCTRCPFRIRFIWAS